MFSSLFARGFFNFTVPGLQLLIMRLQYLPLGLVTSVTAKTLYVSSYSGTVTTLELTAQKNGSYSLTTVAVNNSTAPQPSWLEKVGDVVYLADENFNGPGAIAAYKRSASGELVQFDSHNTLNGPVSLVPYNGGKGLASAHYSGSALTSWTIDSKTGALTSLQNFTFTLTKPGTNPDRQEAPHPHEVILDPTDRFIVSPDLGADLLHVFSINKNDSSLVQRTSFAVPAGSGPRHGTFLKTGNATYFYLISELANTVASYEVSYNQNDLGFKQLQILGTYGNISTPAGAASAEAILSPDHKYLLTSSRNATLFQIPNFSPQNSTRIPSDTLQTWAIDHTTGLLTFKQLAPCGGSYPRQFSVNQDGSLAAVGLQNDGRVVVLTRDVDKGLFGNFVASINIEGQITSVVWDE